MARPSKRVLILGSLETSREAALILSEELKSNGYSPVFCHTGAEDFNIQEDRILEENMSLTDIVGVVFLDNGGDYDLALELAKEAYKKDLVIGALGVGCVVVKDAEITKDSILCSGLPEELYEGAKMAEAPAVRSGTLVTCSGSKESIRGFAILLVGALGGKYKNMVTSEVSDENFLVVDKLDNWPSYWKLSSNKVRVVLADYADIDFEKSLLSGVSLNSENGNINPVSGKIPSLFLFLQTMPENDIIASVKKLESVGSASFNSALAMQASGQESVLDSLSLIFDTGKKVEESDIIHLMEAGNEISLIKEGSLKRVVGRGSFALVLGTNRHQMIPKENLFKEIEGGRLLNCKLVSDGLEALASFTIQRKATGWEITHRNALLNNRPADINILENAVENFKEFNKKCDIMTHQACLLVESSLNNPSEFNWLNVLFSSSNNEPKLVKVSAIPIFSQTQLAEEPLKIDLSNIGRQKQLEDIERKKRDLEREMAHEGIFIQPDGSVGLTLGDESKKMDIFNAIDLMARAFGRVNDEVIAIRRTNYNERELSRLQRISGSFRHKLRILMGYWHLNKQPKVAESIEGVNGWYSNMDLTMKERVAPWEEDEEDFLISDKLIRNQDRYRPEYDNNGDQKDTNGFYYVWWEIANEPYYWSRILQEGIYPMISQYKGIGTGKR